jgi:predicted ester cyclase
MAAQNSTAVVVNRWAALWSGGDLSDASDIFTPDVRDHRAPPFPGIHGLDEERRFIAWVRSAFPDLQVEIADQVVEGDRVAARVVHRGARHGDFLGIAPTGRAAAYEGSVIFRIVDGRIAERSGTVDLYGLLAQLTDTVPSPTLQVRRHLPATQKARG